MPNRHAQRFETEVLPHLDAGYNLARWLTRDAHDAQDVCQEACLRALRYIDSLRAGQGRAWFLTVVRHAFYDWYRDKRRGREGADEGKLDESESGGSESAAAWTSADPVWNAEVEALADPMALDPEEAAMHSSEARILSRAVAALPVSMREVLVLREFEDLSYKEISAVLGVPAGTVMSRLARAREAVISLSRELAAGRPVQAMHTGEETP
jgi:RNA polymerase sigma-70 factor (ECF subfamily)